MPHLRPRQGLGTTDPNAATDNADDAYYYYSIKWAILTAIFLVFLVFFVGGYIHAKQRMRKGKPLRAYHRWLVARSVRTMYEAGRTGQPVVDGYGNGREWPMNNYGNGSGQPRGGYGGMGAPPAYNPDTDYVPPYAPPGPGFTNHSKVDPDQRQSTRVREQEVGVSSSSQVPAPTPSYQAPSAPPPK